MLEYARSSLRIRSFIIFLLLSVPLSAAHIAPAAAQMSERPDGGGRPRGGSGVGVGVGIDVGIGIANELMRQRARDEEIERSIRAQRKKKETAKPAPAAGPKKPPVELGIYTPPVFPEIPRPTNCDDCMKLWNSLVEYERIIAPKTPGSSRSAGSRSTISTPSCSICAAGCKAPARHTTGPITGA